MTQRAYTRSPLGPKRYLTREGYLVCQDVPLARTGQLVYGAGEIPAKAGANGLIYVNRTAESLFAPHVLDSAVGKPVTLRHPTGNRVTLDNHGYLSRGHIQAVRRGTPTQDRPDLDQFMLGDIVFTEKHTIDSVNSAIARGEYPEVSLGYDADYPETGPGTADQVINGINHVAVVPKGRCGPSCAIGDEETIMSKQPSWATKLTTAITQAFRDNNADAAVAAVNLAVAEDAAATADAEGARATADAALAQTITQLTERLNVLETAERTRAQAATADAATRQAQATADAALTTRYPAARMAGIRSSAEILSPGFQMATVDAAATVDCARAMCDCQRGALTAFATTDDGKAILTQLNAQAIDLATADASAIDLLFASAAALKAKANNTVGMQGKPPEATGDQRPLTAGEKLQAGIDRAYGKK